MYVISTGVEFLRKISKFEKKKMNSSSFVHILDKTWKRAILRRSRAVRAKKCAKECAARGKLLFS